MTANKDNFHLWYTKPLRHLEQLPDGQGGFIVLATACFLYERYANAILEKSGKKADKLNLKKQLASDMRVNEETASAFWDVIRDGLLHQGMPKKKEHGKDLPRWGFYESYPPMHLDEVNGDPYLRVEPFKFMNEVLMLWERNFELIQASGSFPWASIGPVPK